MGKNGDAKSDCAQGRELRQHASFYEMIDRMEQSGVIESWFEERDVEGQKFNEKPYRLTAKGRINALNDHTILRTEN